MLIYLWFTFCVLIIVFYIHLNIIKYKINGLEEKIQEQFLERSDLIPSLFEVSKLYVTKHDEIFNEILELRKREFGELIKCDNLHLVLRTKKMIHHEINFLFKIFNKHNRLTKEWKFIYLRNLIIKKSFDIWNDLEKYKILVIQLNKLINIKNFTILWLFLPISKKIEI